MTIHHIKKQAQILKDYLIHTNNKISHSSCLHAIAKINGFENWNTMKALYERKNKTTVEAGFDKLPMIQIATSVFNIIKNGGSDGKLGSDAVLMLSYILDNLTDNSLVVLGFTCKHMSLWDIWTQERFDKALEQLIHQGFIGKTFDYKYSDKIIITINPTYFWKGTSEKRHEAIDLRFMALYFSSELLPRFFQIELDHERVIVFAEDERNKNWRDAVLSKLKNHSDDDAGELVHYFIEGMGGIQNLMRGQQSLYVSEMIKEAEEENSRLSIYNQKSVEFNITPEIEIKDHPKILEVQKFIQQQKLVSNSKIFLKKIKEIVGSDYYVGYDEQHVHIKAPDKQDILAYCSLSRTI